MSLLATNPEGIGITIDTLLTAYISRIVPPDVFSFDPPEPVSPMMPFSLSHFQMRRLGWWMIPVTLASAITCATFSPSASQTPQTTDQNRSLIINATRQEANSKTGVFTATGNVRINYPARQIQATAAQAQYFSRERKIVLNGNVYVLQEGNSIKGDSITYLIDEGRFIATPKANTQVESIYIINDTNPQTQPQAAPQTPAFNPKPASPNPASTPVAPRGRF